MKNKISIVKIGGSIIDDEQGLDSFLIGFAKIKHPKILVHGGGKIATKLNEELGINTVMNDGRRITSKESLDNVTMVYAGLINKNIVSKLQGNNCNAIGLSGADANSILATKRPSETIDFGWVGDVKKINTSIIQMFVSNNMSPIYCAISHDGNGQLLNTNADTIASEIAIAMSELYETELVYCFEKKGVLEDINDENSVIEIVDSIKYTQLKQKKIIHQGMLPKMENCFHALNNNVGRVIIGNSEAINNSELCTTLTL
ncbi:MAG: acetylglutamate kinase [Flavobacteriales bacterium]|nr:acetylglutamate kinase [Flavobacteriales bacterium]